MKTITFGEWHHLLALTFIGSDHPLCNEEPNTMITLPEISELLKTNFK